MTAEAATHAGFTIADTPPAHVARAKQVLAAHPELRVLFGRDLASFAWTVALVALQVSIAVALVVWGAPWWAILLVAYVIGAFVNHALFVLIHDYTHNLVFRATNANRLGAIFANIPIVFPAAIGFRNFHLLHHRLYLPLPFLRARAHTRPRRV